MEPIKSHNKSHVHKLTLAERDKRIMQLQDQIDNKEAELKKTYKELKKNVGENPYLQYALDEYNNYFDIYRQQITALKNILKLNPTMNESDIRREIAALEKNLV